jgi:hypothetical protein
MQRISGIAASAVMSARPVALPWPELPAGIPENPRVMRLIDLDGVSRGLARGTSLGRASNQDVLLFLDTVQATAHALDPQSRVRCAASTATAVCHFDVLTAAGRNHWSIRRRRDGVERVLLEEMNDLISTRLLATRPGNKRAARHTDLVILVGQDHIYAPPVRRLRLLGIPTWLVVPGRPGAASLYSCACAVTFLSRPASLPTHAQPAIPAC